MLPKFVTQFTPSAFVFVFIDEYIAENDITSQSVNSHCDVRIPHYRDEVFINASYTHQEISRHQSTQRHYW